MLTPEQKKLRYGRIGSSSIAALVDQHKWMRPIDVFSEATIPGYQRARSKSEERRLLLGHLLEPVVLALHADETGAEQARPGTLVHPVFDFLLSTPDAVSQIVRDVVNTQAKSCAFFDREEWGEPGTDIVPAQIIHQTTMEMRILIDNGIHVDYTHVPVLFWGRQFEIYRIEYNKALADHLIEVASDFYYNHIKPGIPPPVDDSPAYERYVKLVSPKETKPLKPGTERERQLAAMYVEQQELEKQLEAKKQQLKNALLVSIGDAEGLEVEGFKVTWLADKNGKRSLRVEPKGVAA